MVETDADRLEMLADFGEAFTVSGVPGQVTGVFDNPYSEPFSDVESTSPSVIFRSVDVPAIAQGDSITRVSTSQALQAINVQPDGAGMVVVLLDLQ